MIMTQTIKGAIGVLFSWIIKSKSIKYPIFFTKGIDKACIVCYIIIISESIKLKYGRLRYSIIGGNCEKWERENRICWWHLSV